MNPSLREGEQWRVELSAAAALSLSLKNHGFITNSSLIGTKNGSKSELGVYQSPPVRIAQLLFGGSAAPPLA
jgi:hypothetical protein